MRESEKWGRNRHVGFSFSIFFFLTLVTPPLLGGDDPPDRLQNTDRVHYAAGQAAIFATDPRAVAEIRGQISFLEDPATEDLSATRFSLSATSWKHSRTFPSKYGEVSWHWNNSDDYAETLRRSSFQFTVSATEHESSQTVIEDSAGGRFVLDRNRRGEVEKIGFLGGRLVLKRSFDENTGRLEREEIQGVLSVTYDYADVASLQWKRRTIRTGPDDTVLIVQSFSPTGITAGGFGALFADPLTPDTLQPSYGEDYSPTPYHLPIARASANGGIILASLFEATYAGLDPATGNVLYRRIATGDSRTAGVTHEFLQTDNDFYVILDPAGGNHLKVFHLMIAPPSASRRAHMMMVENCYYQAYCAYAGGQTCELGYDYICDYLYWPDYGTGGGGGTGGGTGDGTGGGTGGGGTTGASVTERTSIINQYSTYGCAEPAAGDFVNQNTYQDPGHFSWNEVQSHDGASWALVISGLLNGLEQTRSNYGNALNLSRAYSTPDYNASVGGENCSDHTYGEAADILTNDNCTAWNAIAKAASDAGAWIESISKSTSNHVHVSWGRSANPGGYGTCQ